MIKRFKLRVIGLLLVGTVVLFYSGYRFNQLIRSSQPYDQARARLFGDELESLRPQLTRMTLCALDPDDGKYASAKGDEPTFSGGTTIGCAELDVLVRDEVFDSVLRRVRNYSRPRMQNGCAFRPHHGLRMTFADGREIDFSICFTCYHTYVSGAEYSGYAVGLLVPRDAEKYLNAYSGFFRNPPTSLTLARSGTVRPSPSSSLLSVPTTCATTLGGSRLS